MTFLQQHICVVGGRPASTPPRQQCFAWLAGGGCGCPAGLPEAVDYVPGLCCGLVALQWATAAAALSVSKLLKSDFSQAFLLLSCCCAAWMSRASANVPIFLYVFVLSRSGVMLCWHAMLLHLPCRPICQLSPYMIHLSKHNA